MGVRIVPGQHHNALLAALKKQRGVEVSFSNESASPAWTTDTEAPAFAAARKALQKGYGRQAAEMGCGGSIPFVGPFRQGAQGRPRPAHRRRGPAVESALRERDLHLAIFAKAVASAAHRYGRRIASALRRATTRAA